LGQEQVWEDEHMHGMVAACLQANSRCHVLPLRFSQWMGFDVTRENVQPWSQLLVP